MKRVEAIIKPTKRDKVPVEEAIRIRTGERGSKAL